MSSIAKTVKRFQKIVLGGIVAVMALSLVLWGFVGQTDPKDKGDAGIIFDTVKVTKEDFNDAHRRTVGVARAMALGELPAMSMGRGMQVWMSADPRYEFYKPEAFRRLADGRVIELTWEHLILLWDAKQKGITVSDDEVNQRTQALTSGFFQAKQPSEKDYGDFVEQVFYVKADQFEKLIQEALVIEKLLDLVTGAEFAAFDRIYADIVGQNKVVRVQYTAFDPKNYLTQLKPVKLDEIMKYYNENKDTKFKIPERIQVEYLLADLEELKKKMADPSEDEIKEYYEKNKSNYVKPTPTPRGATPPPAEYFTLAEVRQKVIDAWKEKKADDQAYKLMREADSEIGKLLSKGEIPKEKDVFGDLRTMFRARGIELSYDVTLPFDQKTIEEIEKTVGENSNISTQFGTDVKVGDISRVWKTKKGYVIYRLQKKTAAYVPALNDPMKEKITKVLQKRQLRKRANTAATTASQDINSAGLAHARQKFGLEFKMSKYFKAQGQDPMGIEDQGLSQAIRQEVTRLKVGVASVIDGTALGQQHEKRDWSFVVYLDDEVLRPPEGEEQAFNDRWERENRRVRMEGKEKYTKALVESAKLKDYMGKPKEKPAFPGEGEHFPGDGHDH